MYGNIKGSSDDPGVNGNNGRGVGGVDGRGVGGADNRGAGGGVGVSFALLRLFDEPEKNMYSCFILMAKLEKTLHVFQNKWNV